jgi:hypothetical protein
VYRTQTYNVVPAIRGKAKVSSKPDMADLQETEHESFRLPTNKDISVWRYMDLAKFLSMLDRRCLFFARATLLGDAFEGSSTKAMVSQREFVRANRATDPSLVAFKDLPETFFTLGDTYKRLVESYLISCWHMNEHESAAMWKLYSTSNEAVCIQSTYRRLRQCLPECVFIGEVSYINYETDGFSSDNVLNFIMHKRLSFAHERELRAVFWHRAKSPDTQPYNAKVEPSGLAMEVDLSALIERVYVSPTAAPWFAKLVEAMTAKCGFEFPVSQSVLAESPLY